MKIVIGGNCQSASLAALLRYYLPGSDISSFEYFQLADFSTLERATHAIDTADVVIPVFQAHETPNCFSNTYARQRGKQWITYPSAVFNGWHPDNVYVASAGKWIGPFDSHYNSSLILYGFLAGLTKDQTIKLFSEDTFERLGFFRVWTTAKNQMLLNFLEADMAADGVFDKWAASGPFMHSINHPKLEVMKHVADRVVEKLGLIPATGDPLLAVADPLLFNMVWPVYPEIGARHGVAGGYRFKLHDLVAPHFGLFKTLEEMVEASFYEYGMHDRNSLICERISNYSELLSAPSAASPARDVDASSPKSSALHPYKDLPSNRFWNRSFSFKDVAEFDPIGDVPFRISSTDSVAAAGSCFAQHISARLKAAGLNYLVAEDGPVHKNFGAFSARYGNIYTARQLVQLFDRAHDHGMFPKNIWKMPNGHYADAFRPQVEPGGFATREELQEDRIGHLSAVRTMFSESDVFIFTLGLTESWRSIKSGAVFPLAPGVVAGGQKAIASCEFINFSMSEVETDILAFVDRIRAVNKEVRIILTVSPVPLAATYEPRHVLLSTTYSKSALRAAADAVTRQRKDVFYFPSYEIITGSYNRGRYFDDTLRNVTTRGVDHVMSLFFRHVVDDFTDTEAKRSQSELAEVGRILCDEERLAV